MLPPILPGSSEPSKETEIPKDKHLPRIGFARNPESDRYDFHKRSDGTYINRHDGSVWSIDTSSHGGEQWKRWVDERSKEKNHTPDSIRPDGRTRKRGTTQ